MISAAKFPESAFLVKTAPWPLYDDTPTSNPLTILTPPIGSFRCKVTISAVTGHATCGGTITIAGEVLTFSAAGTKSSTATLTSKPAVTYGGGLNCHVLIYAISTLGADILAESLTTIDIVFDDTRKGYWNAEGIWVISNSRAQTENTTAIIGDVLRYTAEGDSASIDYPIKFIQRVKRRLAIEEFRILQF